ncbi:MAG: hypothetical protein QN141_02605 [Armatimonadota bacterium]|nr:hypothetical protein [Armatimonadota bacterium]MDR7450791.1 hypothetical protein [Armatimonadota bacterium]MDR7466147.1 hypothetical protein [Armatimonadota bacterium]MDR7493816.1 hypothetical protein [Armatimonadota bacterium]MDR7499023.1 hypothetical protein [Armatimonadota bacterium]
MRKLAILALLALLLGLAVPVGAGDSLPGGSFRFMTAGDSLPGGS